MGAVPGITGPRRDAGLREQAARANASEVGTRYDADLWASAIETDRSLKTRVGSKLFVNVPIARHLSVVELDQDITVKLVATDGWVGPPITFRAGVPWDDHTIEFVDILLTTAAVTTNLQFVIR